MLIKPWHIPVRRFFCILATRKLEREQKLTKQGAVVLRRFFALPPMYAQTKCGKTLCTGIFAMQAN